MLKKFAITAAAVLVAGAGVAAALPAKASASPGWQIAREFHGMKVEVSAVAAAPGGTVWAFVGYNSPETFQRTGNTWTQLPPFPGGEYFQVDYATASAPDNLWAFAEFYGPHLTSQYRALRWDGHSWTVKATFPLQVGSASVLGPDDVWAFGQVDGQPGNGLGAYHYNGTTWTKVADGTVQGGSALDGNDVWLGHRTSVGHWNGRTWTRTSLTSLLPHGSPGILGVLAESASDVYAVAATSGYKSTIVLHYDGTSWTRVAGGAGTPFAAPVAAMAGDGHGGLWFIGTSAHITGALVAHYAAGRLTTYPVTTAVGKAPQMFAIAQVPGTAQVLAGGYAQDSPMKPRTGLVIQYQG